MRKYSLLLNKSVLSRLILTGLLVLIGSTALADGKCEQRVSIPLPEGGGTLDFCAVFLGLDGDKLFDARKIRLGSRDTPKRLQEVLLSGAFVKERTDSTQRTRKDWLYYIGETEVQKRHWDAIMRWERELIAPELPPLPIETSEYPQTDITVTHIYRFIEYLNTWMLKKHNERLPRYGQSIAFVRLPTEVEWAFAARGGIKVLFENKTLFDAPHPYGDALADHEWNLETSGNKIQESGYLKPNALGLYDMLGNVEEITSSLYGPQYLHGRFGQLTIRGGNFSNNSKYLSASHRTEYFPYRSDGSIRTEKKVGFRLVLSTAISAVGTPPDEEDEAYDEYLSRVPSINYQTPGSSSPTHQAELDQINILNERLASLEINNNRLLAEKNKLEMELTAQKTKVINPLPPQPSSHSSVDKEQQWFEEKKQLEELLQTMKDQLSDKQNELTRLRQQETFFRHEVDKNVRRIRSIEKRHIENLLRLASGNAAGAYRDLKYIEILSGEMGKESKKQRERDAAQMLSDYWSWVQKIAYETKEELFPEVKKSLAEWQYLQEQKGGSPYLRKSLDLIERHVNEVRNGQYRQPDNLLDQFTRQPEFQ